MVRIMSEGIVARFLKCTTAEMIQNNMTEIRCPCRRCKLNWLIDPDSRNLQAHLLHHGFMDGYTRWISDDEDDEAVNGAAENEEGGQHDHDHGKDGRDEEESPGDGEGAEADQDDDDDLDAGGTDDNGTTSG